MWLRTVFSLAQTAAPVVGVLSCNLKKINEKNIYACFNQPAARIKSICSCCYKKRLWNKRRLFNLSKIKARNLKLNDKHLKNRSIAIKYYKYLIPTVYREFYGIRSFLDILMP